MRMNMKNAHLHKLFSLILSLILIGGGFVSVAQRQVTENPETYNEKGVASFYSTRFDGQLTATGEAFDSKKMTAASNELPLNTYVKVTNLENGKWVVVRINDRMAKDNKRLIDLTKSVAKKLGFVKDGLTKVLVEYVPQEFYAFFGLSPNELLLFSSRI